MAAAATAAATAAVWRTKSENAAFPSQMGRAHFLMLQRLVQGGYGGQNVHLPNSLGIMPRHTLHSLLFTLHSSEFARGATPYVAGPWGVLVGWWT